METRQTSTRFHRHNIEAPENGKRPLGPQEKKPTALEFFNQPTCRSALGVKVRLACMCGFGGTSAENIQFIKTDTSRQRERKSENGSISMSDHVFREPSVRVAVHRALGLYMV